MTSIGSNEQSNVLTINPDTDGSSPNLLLILGEFKRINWLLLPFKSIENLRFSDDFRGNRSYLIRLNLLNVRNKFGDEHLTHLNGLKVTVTDILHTQGFLKKLYYIILKKSISIRFLEFLTWKSWS